MNLQRVYFDHIRGSKLEVLQVADYSIQVRYANEENDEIEYDKDEVAKFLADGVWSTPLPEPKSEKKKAQKATKAPETKQEDTFTAYVSSMKALREGSYARITMESKKGYFEVAVTPKSGIMEIDLTKLDKSQIDKILSVLEDKPKEAKNE